MTKVLEIHLILSLIHRRIAMNAKSTGKISYTLQAFNIIPLLFLGIVATLLASQWFSKIMYDEVELGLNNVAHNVETLFDVAYPGDYHLEGDTALRLYKGDHDITGDYSLIDRVKENTGLEITLFYKDTRILTTIYDSKNERIIGTGAPEQVLNDVYKTGESHFYTNTLINYVEYFSYYMPLYNSDDNVVGMLFVGKPCKQVDKAVQTTVYPMIAANILVMLIATVSVFLYLKKFTNELMKIHHFLSDVSTGNLNAELDSSVLRRNDELGDIGRSALTMQRSLRNMVERDALTELFNRRSGGRKLQQLAAKSAAKNIPYCLAIGDIDFFKKVNDTYGHDCGDVVLKNIADQMRAHMFHNGFVARWGGEEFLIVFEHMNLIQARESLEDLLNKIRAFENKYDDEIIKVTMTFGLVPGDTEDIRHLITSADEKLYEGKTSGRNRIIS